MVPFVSVVRGGGVSHSPAAPRAPPPNCAVFAQFEEVCVCGAVLSVGRRVYEGVDDAGGPGEDGGDDVQPGVRDAVVSHVHDHERQEARQEAQEDGQHEGREAGVFFFLFCCLAGQFAVDKGEVF